MTVAAWTLALFDAPLHEPMLLSRCLNIYQDAIINHWKTCFFAPLFGGACLTPSTCDSTQSKSIQSHHSQCTWRYKCNWNSEIKVYCEKIKRFFRYLTSPANSHKCPVVEQQNKNSYLRSVKSCWWPLWRILESESRTKKCQIEEKIQWKEM